MIVKRHLVTIRKVRKISPIKGADFIELAHVDGWQCVVKKGDFKVGDLAVYFEIDSFLPIDKRYEFLRKGFYKKDPLTGREGFQIKTIKLRGELSQGLLIPLSLFPELKGLSLKEYDDVTALLNVVKYEPPIPANMTGVAKGSFPYYIQKTDEERIQNLLEYFDTYKNWSFECTVKLDGTSVTYFYKDGYFGACSRNYELVEDPAIVYWKISYQLKLKELLIKYNRNLALQGEIIGERITKNHERLRGQHFYLFDIYDIDKQQLMTPKERIDTLNEINDLTDQSINHVPNYGSVKIFQICPTIDELLNYTATFDNGRSLTDNTKREGLVFKSDKREGKKIISFKVVNRADQNFFF